MQAIEILAISEHLDDDYFSSPLNKKMRGGNMNSKTDSLGQNSGI